MICTQPDASADVHPLRSTENKECGPFSRQNSVLENNRDFELEQNGLSQNGLSQNGLSQNG